MRNHLFKHCVCLITGLQNAKTEHKVVTEVVQDGDNYTWTQTIPGWSWSISFTIGKECEMESIKGVTFKVSYNHWTEELPNTDSVI